jgi:hypothetical protein
MYTALVLDENSHKLLISIFKDLIPAGWKTIAHHMTINLGKFEKGPLTNSNFKIGDSAKLTAIKAAQDNLVLAVEVVSDVPSVNSIKHVTIAVNEKDGGKAFLSNKLTNWTEISPIGLKGTILEQN